MEFPVFTVCPKYSNAFKYAILKKDKLSPSDLRKFNYPKYVDSAKYLEKISYNLSEVIKSISVLVQETSFGNNSTEFILFSSNIKMMNYTDQFYHHFGRCYTFQIPLWIQKLLVNVFPIWLELLIIILIIINFEFQILEIQITTKIKTSIWVHHPGQWLYPDTDSNLNVNLGELEFIILSYSFIYSLPEVHNCGEYNLNSFDYCIKDVC